MIESTARGSIQRDLTRLVLACVAFTTLPVAAYFTWSEARRHADSRWAVMKTAADVLASSTVEAAELRDSDRAFSAIRAVTRTPGIVYARVQTADGQVLADTGGGARLKSDVSLSADGKNPGVGDLIFTRSIEVKADIASPRGRLGQVIIVHKADGLAEALFTSLAAVLALAALALIGALWAARRLQMAMTAPLVELTHAVSAIATDADFSRTVSPKDARNEVADLVSAFNTLIEAIGVRDARIDAQMKGLEAEVQSRTRDYVAARDEANAANAAKSDFLATMSHEIRTPLNGVMVMAELMAAETLPPRAAKNAATIVKSGRNLLAVINDILDFSKIEAGKLEVETLSVDIPDLLDDTLALFAARAREKGLELVGSVHPDVPRFIPADPVRLGQVITNLVSNALKFTESGHVLVQVRPDTDPGFWRLVVSDTGIGIDAAKLATLFDAFTQADQSTTRKFGGTGLGLSISKRLIEAMGGGIGVASEPGKGTRFHARLPLEFAGITAEGTSGPPSLSALETPPHVALHLSGPMETQATAYRFDVAGAERTDDAADLIIADAANRDGLSHIAPDRLVLAAAADDTEAQSLLAKGLAAAVIDQPLRLRDIDGLMACLIEGRPFSDLNPQVQTTDAGASLIYPTAQVLIVDDGEINREVAREALSRFGITAREAVDGEEALRLTAQTDFDLVLMDGSMPVMDGYEATRRIREREVDTGGRVPVVALTAHVVGHAAEAWRDAGMDDVLHKPFSLAALGDVLQRFLPAGRAVLADTDTLARPATAISEPESEAFDPEVMAELKTALTSGRADFVTRVTGLYERHAPKCVSDMLRAHAQARHDDLGRAAHALKSMSLNIGARAVAQAAAAIEAAVRDNVRAVPGSEVMAIEPLVAEAIAHMATLVASDDDGQNRPVAPRVAVMSEEDSLIGELKQALSDKVFVMAYQPIMDKTGQQVISAEALIRWPRGDRPPVGPDTFVPLAERLGLIPQLGQVARELVLKDAVLCPGIPLAVNVSPIELLQPGFMDGLKRLLAETGMDARRLVLEMTETAFLGEPDRTRRLFAELRALGIKLALDDFGVGYSSLTALHRFAFDKLKIDREFVSALDGEPRGALEALTIIQAVTSIGRAFGLQVVAEGVETKTQHDHLRAAGVHGLQGYLFAKPMPMDDLVDFLKQQGRKSA